MKSGSQVSLHPLEKALFDAIADTKQTTEKRLEKVQSMLADFQTFKETMSLAIEKFNAGSTTKIDDIKLFLPNIDKVDSDGNTPLLAAYDAKFPAVVPMLIKAGANVNIGFKYGTCTPLRYFCNDDANVDAVEALIKAGANINTLGSENQSPALVCAVNLGQEKMTALLVKNGANLNLKGLDGVAALDYAIANKNCNNVLLLLQAKAAFENKDALKSFLINIEVKDDEASRACLKVLYDQKHETMVREIICTRALLRDEKTPDLALKDLQWYYDLSQDKTILFLILKHLNKLQQYSEAIECYKLIIKYPDAQKDPKELFEILTILRVIPLPTSQAREKASLELEILKILMHIEDANKNKLFATHPEEWKIAKKGCDSLLCNAYIRAHEDSKQVKPAALAKESFLPAMYDLAQRSQKAKEYRAAAVQYTGLLALLTGIDDKKIETVFAVKPDIIAQWRRNANSYLNSGEAGALPRHGDFIIWLKKILEIIVQPLGAEFNLLELPQKYFIHDVIYSLIKNWSNVKAYIPDHFRDFLEMPKESNFAKDYLVGLQDSLGSLLDRYQLPSEELQKEIVSWVRGIYQSQKKPVEDQKSVPLVVVVTPSKVATQPSSSAAMLSRMPAGMYGGINVVVVDTNNASAPPLTESVYPSLPVYKPPVAELKPEVVVVQSGNALTKMG